MRPICPWLVFMVAASCVRASAPPPPPVADDCTLATPLVPGVPGSPGHLMPSELNPNGVSELAALMRRFLDDLRQARDRIARGEEAPALSRSHKKLRCAWPTEPERRDPTYDAFAQGYLAHLQALEASPARPEAAYDAVVAACLACHEALCPGPIPAIESLKRE